MTTPATPPPPAPVPPTIHELKTWPEYFDAVRDGRKTFEIRRNDRDFKVGDVLLLQEYDLPTNQYSGYDVSRRITYITDYAQAEGIVVMGIEPVDATRAPLPAEPAAVGFRELTAEEAAIEAKRAGKFVASGLPPTQSVPIGSVVKIPPEIPIEDWPAVKRYLDTLSAGKISPKTEGRLAEPTASESSGDVQLWQAKSEIMRLKGEFEKARQWNTLTQLEVKNLRSLVADLTQDIDSIDMLRDEFQRIKACPDVTDEIAGLCERALLDIKQKVPVIQQRDEATAALAAAHTKALAQEGMIERLREALLLYREAYEPDGHVAPHDCFSTGPKTGPSIGNKIYDHVACPGCAVKKAADRALATPSPAPVAGNTSTSQTEQLSGTDRDTPGKPNEITALAGGTVSERPGVVAVMGGNYDASKFDSVPAAGKTNPPEISSPVVDGGEKDSAGPTPRTDEFSRESSSQIPGGGNADMGDVHDHAARIADFARTLERELTASESLRREAFGLLEISKCPDCDGSGVYMTGGLYPDPQQCQFCFEKAALLTTPVAGEGGEG